MILRAGFSVRISGLCSHQGTRQKLPLTSVGEESFSFSFACYCHWQCYSFFVNLLFGSPCNCIATETRTISYSCQLLSIPLPYASCRLSLCQHCEATVRKMLYFSPMIAKFFLQYQNCITSRFCKLIDPLISF